MFTTKRLILRAYREGDFAETVAFWNDFDNQQVTVIDHVVPQGIVEQGFVKDWNRDGEISLALKPEFKDQGYGTEVLAWDLVYAFKSLNLHRVSLRASENEPAMNLYKKSGFAEEGRLRKANWIDGKWANVVLMSILDEEWWLLCKGYHQLK
ncbi:acyl-CoA N-acyltransferase [Abortiporus biennis]|nr:acyl-CoA N-acyltransferase [Abortiporus biennis]